jgi:SAM-dependent methyltransferase
MHVRRIAGGVIGLRWSGKCPGSVARNRRNLTRTVSPMRNANAWVPSKYVFTRGRLTASRDPKQVSVGSRLVTDIVAAAYDEHLRQHCSGRLLDLGCGFVPLFGAYKDLVDEAVCVDWGNSLHRTVHLDLECDLTQRLPLPDGRFETIILSDVLEHIPEPMQLWREMSRLLVPGGKVIVNVPFFYWLHEQPHDYFRYTEFALRRFARLSGFRVLVLQSLGGTPAILTDIFAKHAVRFGPFGSLLAATASSVCRQLIGTSVGAKIASKTSANFPLAYFMVAQKLADAPDAT